MWTSPDGITWTAGACAHNGGSDDRESMWVDNNPASPHYGRMYISFNNFLVGTGALQITYSDNGTTWSAAANIPANTNFIRDIQTTGDLSGSGKVYVAAMDESANGGLNPRINHMFRSTDGGVTWADSVMGASFQGPGRSTSRLLCPGVLLDMEAHGVGTARSQRQQRLLRLGTMRAERVMLRSHRPWRRLLPALDRLRSNLERTTQAEHRLRNCDAMAAVTGNHSSRSGVRRVV